jgi:tetratricopeptide (TPR) repeat protein
MVQSQFADRKKNVSNRSRLLPVVVLAAITLLAFSNSFSAGFTLDNKGLILEDPRIRDVTGENVGLILQHTYWWPRGEAGLYRPFTTLSYLFNYAILGNADQPAGYHWINLLLHLGNVLLVYALARRLLREFWPSFLLSAMWAVHPLLTESVTNIIGRSDLLAGFATLSGLLMYLRSTETSGWRRVAWLIGLMAISAVGMFSKESAIVIAGVILLYELTWWKQRKQVKAMFWGLVAILLLAAAMLYQRFIVLGASPPAEFPFTDNPIVGAGFWTGRLTAIKLIARYIGLMLWPANLSTDYSYSQIRVFQGSVGDWAVVIGVLLLAAGAVSLYRWNRTAFFLIWFSAITFLPTSNLLFPIGTIMAERFLYLSTIGFLGCLVMLVFAIAKKREDQRIALILLSIMVIAFGIRTWFRNRDWQDQRSIVEANLKASPNSFKTHMVTAELFSAEGPDYNLDRAIDESEKSIAILDPLPDSLNTPLVYRNAGGEYLAKGDYQKALQALTRSITVDKATRERYDQNGGAEWARRHSTAPASTKGDPDTYWMLSVAYQKLGKSEEAASAASEALRLHPVNPAAYRQIADVFAAVHRTDDAAMALFQGLLMTSDVRLQSDLVNLYRADPSSCALKSGPGGPSLNLACDAVRKSLCPAAVEVLKAAIDRSRWDAAKKLKQTSLRDYGCPAEAFERILPD